MPITIRETKKQGISFLAMPGLRHDKLVGKGLQVSAAILLLSFLQASAAPGGGDRIRSSSSCGALQLLFAAQGDGYNLPEELFQDRPFDFNAAKAVFNTVLVSPGNQGWVTDAQNAGLQVILEFDYKWDFIEGLDIAPKVQSVIDQIAAHPGTIYGVYVADRLNSWAEPANGHPAITPVQMVEYLRLTGRVIHQQLPGLPVFVDVEDEELTCGQEGQVDCSAIQPGSTSIYRYETNAVLSQLKNSGYVDGFLIADNIASSCTIVDGSNCWNPTVQYNAWRSARALWPRPFKILSRTSRLSFFENTYPATDALAQRQSQAAMAIPIQAGADGMDLWGWHVPWIDNGSPSVRTWLNKDAGGNLLWERMKQVAALCVSGTGDTTPPTGTVLRPGAAEQLTVGGAAVIVSDLRDSCCVAWMVVDLSTDGGYTYADSVYRGAYSDTLHWMVPQLVSDSCRIRLIACDAAGNQVTVTSGSLFSIRAATTHTNEGGGSGAAALSVAPMPASDHGTIHFAVPRRCALRLEVEDVIGRRRRVLAAAQYEPGRYTLDWDLTDAEGRALESGVYFVRLQMNKTVLHSNLLVLR